MKNKILLIIILVLSFGKVNSQDLYKVEKSNVRFFSEAPVENIEATSAKAQGLIKLADGQFAFIVPIVSFKFEKPLMEEHFNENYMESNKYKTGSFKGKVTDIDFSETGEYTTQIEGVLNIHGVEQNRVLPANVSIKAGVVSIKSEFEVKLEDHKIKIPKMVIENIAETVQVFVDLTMTPK